jgi:hypothetical protein
MDKGVGSRKEEGMGMGEHSSAVERSDHLLQTYPHHPFKTSYLYSQM